MLLIGCEAPVDDLEAQSLVVQYLDTIKAQDFAKAITFYPPEVRPRWRAYLKKANEKLGPLQSYKLTGMEVNTVLSGKFFIFFSQGTYQNDKTSEMVTAFIHVRENKMQIVSHKIKSKTFSQ